MAEDLKDSNSNDSSADILLRDTDEVDLQDDKSDKSSKLDVSDKDDTDESEDKNKDDESLSLSDDDKEGDDLTYASLPPVRELKEKFPDFFKKYPNIEKTLRREQHYAEVFPTIQEARDAAESAQYFNEIKSELSSGSITNLLSELKKDNNSAFTKITESLLDTIREVDGEAFKRITTDNVSVILKNAYSRFKDAADDSDNKQIAIAAKILYNYIFEGQAPPDRTNRGTDQKSDKEKEFERRQQEFESRKFDSAVRDVNTRVKSIVQREIEKSIDPREQMTAYVKGKAVQECIDNLVESIQSDARFNRLLEGKYAESRRDDYSEKSKAAIRKMLLSRAETLLPSIMRKVKDEALKGTGRKEKSDEKPLPRGKAATNDNKNKGSEKGQKEQIPAGMSSADYLLSLG